MLERFTSEFIYRRQFSLKRYLNRLLKNPLHVKSNELRDFLTSEYFQCNTKDVEEKSTNRLNLLEKTADFLTKKLVFNDSPSVHGLSLQLKSYCSILVYHLKNLRNLLLDLHESINSFDSYNNDYGLMSERLSLHLNNGSFEYYALKLSDLVPKQSIIHEFKFATSTGTNLFGPLKQLNEVLTYELEPTINEKICYIESFIVFF